LRCRPFARRPDDPVVPGESEKTGTISQLFERFDATLRHFGYKTMSGQIV